MDQKQDCDTAENSAHQTCILFLYTERRRLSHCIFSANLFKMLLSLHVDSSSHSYEPRPFLGFCLP